MPTTRFVFILFALGWVALMSVQRRTVQPKRPIPSMLVRVIVRIANAVLTFSCCSGRRNSGKRKIR